MDEKKKMDARTYWAENEKLRHFNPGGLDFNSEAAYGTKHPYLSLKPRFWVCEHGYVTIDFYNKLSPALSKWETFRLFEDELLKLKDWLNKILPEQKT